MKRHKIKINANEGDVLDAAMDVAYDMNDDELREHGFDPMLVDAALALVHAEVGLDFEIDVSTATLEVLDTAMRIAYDEGAHGFDPRDVHTLQAKFDRAQMGDRDRFGVPYWDPSSEVYEKPSIGIPYATQYGGSDVGDGRVWRVCPECGEEIDEHVNAQGELDSNNYGEHYVAKHSQVQS